MAASTPPPAPSCAQPPTNCNLVCNPICKQGYQCVLSVIDDLCECPVAKCVKPFDTGSGDSGTKKPTPSASSTSTSSLAPTPTSSDNNNNNQEKKSVVGPVLGAVFGLVALALIAFFLLRRHRRRRHTNAEQLMSHEGAEGAEDDNDNDLSYHQHHQHSMDSKEWYEHGDTANREVIRIAYIPRTGSEASLPMSEQLADLGAPQAAFRTMTDENRNKHDSMASTVSTGTLDQAIKMAVKSVATPHLVRLNTIKATQSDLIQRSNSLHSSNSIKRSKSQKRLAEAKRLNNMNTKNSASSLSSPLGSTTPPGQMQEERDIKTQLSQNDKEEVEEQDDDDPNYYTPAVILTGPSARSSAQSSVSQHRIQGPTMVLESRPIQQRAPTPIQPIPTTTSASVSSSSNTFASSAPTPTPTALVSLLASSSSSSSSSTPLHSPTSPRMPRNPFISPPTSPTPTPPPQSPSASRVTTPIKSSSQSAAVTAVTAVTTTTKPTASTDTATTAPPRISFEPTDPFSMELHDSFDMDHTFGNLRPWASNNHHHQNRGHRDSTFSTGSSARSLSTRADGEEIMIFWDGHRDSKVSLS
ncbi:hypothetical protein BG004_002300 [Podila humilis]|nr:hypothetical protein BG004_002300 [Podila humilis]